MERKPKYKYDIIICDICEGMGTQSHEEMTCYHKREYDYTYSLCWKCEGSGMLKKKVTIEYEPHKTNIHAVETKPYTPRKF